MWRRTKLGKRGPLASRPAICGNDTCKRRKDQTHSRRVTTSYWSIFARMVRADGSYSNCIGKRTDITSPGRSGGDCTVCMRPCVFWWDHNSSGEGAGFLWTFTHTCYASRSFNNAVLTDITEGLFSAVKHWVFGQGSQSPTLFMAVVRIARGCLELYRKPFLTNYVKLMKRVIKENKETTVRCVHPLYVRCRADNTHVVTTLTHTELCSKHSGRS